MNKNWKGFIVIILLLSLTMLMMSCGDEKETSIEQVMKFMIPGEGLSYDPNTSNETYSSVILHHMYEGLVTIASDGSLVPGAAERFEITDKNTTFTFYLRKNLKWSDGEAITAHDYKNSWMRFISPDTELVNASMISPYILNMTEYMAGEVDESELGIKVIDEFTLEIKTKGPTPFLIDILTHNIFFPVRFDVMEKGGDSWDKNPNIAVSNGPFVLSDYVAGDYMELTPNPYYWDAARIKLDKMVFLFRSLDSDIVQLYNNDDVDGLFEITATELRNIPDGELETNSMVLPSTAFMTFNHENELMQNVKFREAISISIDRKGVVEQVLLGAGIPSKYLVPLNYQIGGESFRDYTELDDGIQIDKSKALLQELRDEGLFDDRPIKFHYMKNGPDAEVSEYLISKLESDLDIEFEIIGLTWPELYEVALNADYDLLMMGWGADYPHPMTFLTLFEKDAFYAPITRWRNLEYEKAIDDFLTITDEAEALKALKSIEDMILDEYHIAPVYYRKGISLMSKDVKGWYRSVNVFNFTRAWKE